MMYHRVNKLYIRMKHGGQKQKKHGGLINNEMSESYCNNNEKPPI